MSHTAISTIAEEKLEKLLKQGVSARHSALALGIDESTLSKWFKSTAGQELVGKVRAELIEQRSKETEITDLFTDIQHTALTRLSEKVEYVHDTKELLAIVAVMAKSAGGTGRVVRGSGASASPVETEYNEEEEVLELDITLPDAPLLTLDETNRVLTVDGRILKTMSLRDLEASAGVEGITNEDTKDGSEDETKVKEVTFIPAAHAPKAPESTEAIFVEEKE